MRASKLGGSVLIHKDRSIPRCGPPPLSQDSVRIGLVARATSVRRNARPVTAVVVWTSADVVESPKQTEEQMLCRQK
jgi:hypothetical protein